MSECTKFADDLKAYVDGELPMLQKRAVQRHIDGCDLCRDEVAGMTQIGKELRLGESFELDPAIRARLLGIVPENAPTVPRRSAMPRRFSLAFAGSVAAIVALVFIFKPANDSFSPVAMPEANKAAGSAAFAPGAPPADVQGGVKAKSAVKYGNELEDLARQPVTPSMSPAKPQSHYKVEAEDREKAPTVYKKDTQSPVRYAAPSVADFDGLRRAANAAQAKQVYRASRQTEEARHRVQANVQKPGSTVFTDSFNSSQAAANLNVNNQNLNNQNLTQLRSQNSPAPANRNPSVSETTPAGSAAKSRGADTKPMGTQDASSHFYSSLGLGGGGGRGGGFAGGAKGDAGSKGDSGPTVFGGVRSDSAAATPGIVNGVAGPTALSSSTNENLSLRLEVTDIPQKRAAIDKIVKDVNGKLTDLKDAKTASVAATQEATFSLQVSQDNVKLVLGRLEQLGDVVDKSAAPLYEGIVADRVSGVKEQLDRRSVSNKLEESQEAKKIKKESTVQNRRALDYGAARTLSAARNRDKSGEEDRLRGAVRLYSTIIVNLREKKPVQADSAKSKPAGPAGGQRKP